MVVQYTRRRFFWHMGAGCAMGVGLIGGCATAPMFKGSVQGGRLALTTKEFDLTAKNQSGILITAPDLAVTIVLMRDAGGDYHALSSICTHQQCRVRPSGDFIQCPCHGSTYSADGTVTHGPARAPLPAYPVSVSDGMIEIDISGVTG